MTPTKAEIEFKLAYIENSLDELLEELEENLPYWEAIEQALSYIQQAKEEVQKERTND